MMEQQREVSVIGLGDMGGILARTLLHKGWRVTVWNRGAARAQALVAEGVRRRLQPQPHQLQARAPGSTPGVYRDSAPLQMISDRSSWCCRRSPYMSC